MATLNQIAYNLYNTIRQKGNSDDSITLDVIKYQIKIISQTILQQELDKKIDPFFDLSIITDLGCQELEWIDADECGLSSGCMVKRTKNPIPKPMHSNQRMLIYRVGPIIKNKKPFTYIDMLHSSTLFLPEQKFGLNDIYWYLNPSNYHIYLVYNCDNIYAKGLKWINIMLVTFDQSLVECDESNKCCDPDELEFKLPERLLVLVDKIILEQYLKPMAIVPIDDNNDDNFEYSKDTKQ